MENYYEEIFDELSEAESEVESEIESEFVEAEDAISIFGDDEINEIEQETSNLNITNLFNENGFEIFNYLNRRINVNLKIKFVKTSENVRTENEIYIQNEKIRNIVLNMYPNSTMNQIMNYLKKRRITITDNDIRINITDVETINNYFDYVDLMDREFIEENNEYVLNYQIYNKIDRETVEDDFQNNLQRILDEIVRASSEEYRNNAINELENLFNNWPNNDVYYVIRTVTSLGNVNTVAISFGTRQIFLDSIRHVLIQNENDYAVASDGYNLIDLRRLIDVTILSRNELIQNRRLNNRGAVFGYFNKIEKHINLSKYQIYSKENTSMENLEHCLIFALKKHKIDDEKIYKCKQKMKGIFYDKNKLPLIASILGEDIALYELINIEKNNKTEILFYHITSNKMYLTTKSKLKEKNIKINLGLLFNHYIKYEENYKYDVSILKLFKHNRLDVLDKIKKISQVDIVDEEVKIRYVNKNKKSNIYFIKKMFDYDLFEKIDNKNIEEILNKRLKHQYMQLLENKDYIDESDLNYYDPILGICNKFNNIKNNENIDKFFDKILNLDLDENKKKEIKKELHKSINVPKGWDDVEDIIIFADIESYIQEEKFKNEIIYSNIPYSHGHISFEKKQLIKFLEEDEKLSKSNSIIFDTPDCLERFLNYVYKISNKGEKSVKIYYHNLKFDLSLFNSVKNLHHTKRIEKKGNIYQETVFYYGMKIKIVDSYKMISLKLSDFPKTFNLEHNKELLPYRLYNKSNLERKNIDLEEIKNDFNSRAFKKINNITFNEFINHVKKVQKKTNEIFIKENKIDLLKYSNYYLNKDVMVTASGFLTFVKLIYTFSYDPKLIYDPTKRVINVFKKNGINIKKKDLDKISKILIETLGLNENHKFNVFNYLTSSSFADDYLIKNGAYKYVTKIRGTVMDYISKFILGGQTMCAYNKPSKIVLQEELDKAEKNECNIQEYKGFKELQELSKNKKMTEEDKFEFMKNNFKDHISDYDMVSCYPSAMITYDGVIKGKPKLMEKKYLDEINAEKNLNEKMKLIKKLVNPDKACHYFMTVKFKSFKKKSQFPLFVENVKIGDTYSKQYVNELPSESMYVDRYQIHAICKTHQVTDFDVEKMLYFPDGYDNKICKIIKNLFEQRKYYKSINNPIEFVFKLQLNSCYGKTLMKDEEIVKSYFTGDEKSVLKKYVDNMSSFRKIELIKENVLIDGEKKNQYLIQKKNKKVYSTNRGHIGCSILSYSKILMSRPSIISDKLNKPFVCKDTDSMMGKFGNILEVIDEYKKINKKTLNGNDVGQFHVDFKMKDCDIVFGIAGIWLNKKCYCMVLKGININTGEIRYEEIYRYKGVVLNALKFYAENWCKINKIETKFPVYALYNSNDEHKINQVVHDSMKLKTTNFNLKSECILSYYKTVCFIKHKQTFDCMYKINENVSNLFKN